MYSCVFATTFFFQFCPIFTLLVAPSSSSLLPPRPALSVSFSIRKRPFFIDFDESVTDQRTDRPTNGPTDRQPLVEMRERI